MMFSTHYTCVCNMRFMLSCKIKNLIELLKLMHQESKDVVTFFVVQVAHSS